MKQKKLEEQERKNHENFFSKRLNWTKSNAAPKLFNSTEMRAILGNERAAELSKSKIINKQN